MQVDDAGVRIQDAETDASGPALAFSLLRYLSATVRMLSTHLDAASFLPSTAAFSR